MNIDIYLNERVESQIKYFSAKSAQNKRYYLLFKISQLIAAALLPFTSAFITDYSNIKYLVALLGTMVTILEGVLVVGKYQEKWITYRGTGEALRQEKFLFLMKAGIYRGEDVVPEFVSRIEQILGKENAGWQQMIVQEKPAENGNRNSSGSIAGVPVNGMPVDENENISPDNTDDFAVMPVNPAIGVSPDREEVSEMENKHEEDRELETSESADEQRKRL